MKQNKNIPEGYKDSPLGIIPDEWEVKRLKDGIKELEAGVSVNSEKDATITTNAGILKTSCISKGIFYPQEHKKIIIEEINKAKVNPRIGNLIISRMNTPELVGECGYVSSTFKNLFLPDRLWQTIFFDNSCFMPKYLSYILNTDLFKFKIKNIATGTSNSMKNITKEDWLSIKIPTPPSDEQKRIIEILSTWDKAIEKQTTLIEKLKVRKRGLMQQLLTGKRRLLVNDGKWGMVKAGEIFQNISKKGFENEPLLSANQEHGVIPRDSLDTRVTMPTGNTKTFKLVEIGDFVISLRSFQGGIEYSYYRGIVSPAYTILKPKIKICKEFYRQYFKSLNFIGHLAIAVIGIRDGKQISFEDFCSIKIPQPSLPEQIIIAECLNVADKEIALAKLKLQNLKDEKKGLMQVLLTGKKRV